MHSLKIKNCSPSQPPLKTKPNNCYVAKLVEPYCHCDYHLYEPEMGRYMKLAEKEKALYKELDILKKRVIPLTNPNHKVKWVIVVLDGCSSERYFGSSL